MDIWESARPGVNDTSTGWLGRALDLGKGEGPSALALGTGNLPLSLRGRGASLCGLAAIAGRARELHVRRGLQRRRVL